MIKFAKWSKQQLSPFFHSVEFRCRCTETDCDTTLVDPELLNRLDAMRKILKQSIIILGAFRCAKHQQNLRGQGKQTAVGVSQHELGKAVDIMSIGKTTEELEKAASEAGFKSIGLARGWIHVDLRDDKDRRWKYS